MQARTKWNADIRTQLEYIKSGFYIKIYNGFFNRCVLALVHYSVWRLKPMIQIFLNRW